MIATAVSLCIGDHSFTLGSVSSLLNKIDSGFCWFFLTGVSLKTTAISTLMVMAVIGDHSFTLGGVSFLLNKINSEFCWGFF